MSKIWSNQLFCNYINTFYVFIILMMPLYILSSCDNRSDKKNEILSDSLMVQMLTDIFILEGLMIQLEYINRKEQKSAVPYYEVLYQKHGVDREIFVNSVKYYSKDPDHIDKIYDKVIQNLSKKQIKLREEE